MKYAGSSLVHYKDRYMVKIFFIYGLSFIILGASILLYPKRGSAFKLAKKLWLVSAFGIVHGVNEWIDMFILIIKPFEIMPLNSIRMFTLSVSFLFLIQYGVNGIAEIKNKYQVLKALPIILFIAWAFISTTNGQWLLMGDIWARYLIAVPGTFLTSYALMLQLKEFEKIKVQMTNRYLKFAIFAFLSYGFFAGLIVPKAGFFPASVLNHSTFLDKVGVPVQVFRTLCAVAITYSLMQSLSAFELETEKMLRERKSPVSP